MFLVYLLKNDNKSYIGYTNELGEATLLFDQLVESDMTITVTKRNWKPYQGFLSLLTGDIMVNFDGTSNIFVNDEIGNADGLVNPGETIGLSLPLKNYGSESATGVIAHMTSGSELITALDSTVIYGEIAPGESIYGDQFTFVLMPSSKEYRKAYCETMLLLHKPSTTPDNMTEGYDDAEGALSDFVNTDARCPKIVREEYLHSLRMTPLEAEELFANVEDLVPSQGSQTVLVCQEDWMMGL